MHCKQLKGKSIQPWEGHCLVPLPTIHYLPLQESTHRTQNEMNSNFVYRNNEIKMAVKNILYNPGLVARGKEKKKRKILWK